MSLHAVEIFSVQGAQSNESSSSKYIISVHPAVAGRSASSELKMGSDRERETEREKERERRKGDLHHFT
jgi:hypothetical protein